MGFMWVCRWYIFLLVVVYRLLYLVVLTYSVYGWSFELVVSVLECDLSVMILICALWRVAWRRLLSHVLSSIRYISWCVGHAPVHVWVPGECWVTRIDWSILILSVSVVKSAVTGIGWLSGWVSSLLIVSVIRSGVIILSSRSVLLVVVVWSERRGWSGILLELPLLWKVRWEDWCDGICVSAGDCCMVKSSAYLACLMVYWLRVLLIVLVCKLLILIIGKWGGGIGCIAATVASLFLKSVIICAWSWFISFCCAVCVETIDPSLARRTISASLANATASCIDCGFFRRQ